MKSSFKFLVYLLLTVIVLVQLSVVDSLAQTVSQAKTPVPNILCDVSSLLSGDKGKTVVIIISSVFGIVLLLSKFSSVMIMCVISLGGLLLFAKDMIPIYTGNGAMCVNHMSVLDVADSVQTVVSKRKVANIVNPEPAAIQQLPTDLLKERRKCQPLPEEYSDKGYAEWCNASYKDILPYWLKEDVCLRYFWCTQ